MIQESLVQEQLPIHKCLLLVNEESCTETESKHSEKPGRAIQQCNFIPFESKKN